MNAIQWLYFNRTMLIGIYLLFDVVAVAAHTQTRLSHSAELLMVSLSLPLCALSSSFEFMCSLLPLKWRKMAVNERIVTAIVCLLPLQLQLLRLLFSLIKEPQRLCLARCNQCNIYVHNIRLISLPFFACEFVSRFVFVFMCSLCFCSVNSVPIIFECAISISICIHINRLCIATWHIHTHTHASNQLDCIQILSNKKCLHKPNRVSDSVCVCVFILWNFSSKELLKAEETEKWFYHFCVFSKSFLVFISFNCIEFDGWCMRMWNAWCVGLSFSS